jgi:hypothetical protein
MSWHNPLSRVRTKDISEKNRIPRNHDVPGCLVRVVPDHPGGYVRVVPDHPRCHPAKCARMCPPRASLKSKVSSRFGHCPDSYHEVCSAYDSPAHSMLSFSRLCYHSPASVLLLPLQFSRFSYPDILPLLLLLLSCSISRICNKIDFECLFPHKRDSFTYTILRRNVKRRIRRALGTLSEQTLSTSALDMSHASASAVECLVPCGRFRVTASNVVHGRGLVAAIDIPANTSLFAIVGTLVNTRLPCNIDMSSYCWTTPGATVDYCQFFPSSCDASRFINASPSRISANCDVRWVRKIVPVLHSLRAIKAGEEILVFYRF